MADVDHFGCPKFTFDPHFWPFQIDMQLNFFWKFLTKWLPAAILDVRNSLSIAFLLVLCVIVILVGFGIGFLSGYATKFFLEIFDKMAAGGHFGCPKFTFDCISARVVRHSDSRRLRDRLSERIFC